MQADLGHQIASTKRQLNGINANLVEVRSNITTMVKKIDVVRAQYLAQVFDLQQLDVSLDRITVQEDTMVVNLRDRKALLADRLRQAYDTDRTSMLETFLSGESFTDVLSDVSYAIDVSEQDKRSPSRSRKTRQTIAAVHQTVQDMRAAQDDLRIADGRPEGQARSAAQGAEGGPGRAPPPRGRDEAGPRDPERRLRQAHAKQEEHRQGHRRDGFGPASARVEDHRPRRAAVRAGEHPLEVQRLARLADERARSRRTSAAPASSYEPPLGSCPHFHNGIDIVGPACGTPIKSSGDGRVAYIGWNYADGSDPAWIVIIAHSVEPRDVVRPHEGDTYPARVTAGSAVKQGQIIGYEGTTGHSTGATSTGRSSSTATS